MTNVLGLGAAQLAQSLIPALLAEPRSRLEELFVPAGMDLATEGLETSVKPYHRRLPNALSRLLECTVLGKKFDGASPLLVIGDIPLRVNCRQVVFVQTPLLVDAVPLGSVLKFAIMRRVFRANLKFVRIVIVQTEAMRASISRKYPETADKIVVVPQPVPAWLQQSGFRLSQRRWRKGGLLQLFYPAAEYPHKNHALLSRIRPLSSNWPPCEIRLTIPPHHNPAPDRPFVKCIGRLSPADMINAYREADALLFLSKSESFGFPLIEAMYCGLPIVCADRPYARVLCGDQAIYFDPDCPSSLGGAVYKLEQRLDAGWSPDWSERLAKIPKNWNEVASRFAELTLGAIADGRPES
jgi:hypothetical protein